MKLAIGGDHRGREVVRQLATFLATLGHEVQVVHSCNEGGSCDYPDVAYPVGKAVAGGAAELGILVCGTGIGMSIAANKVRGVRAALVHDEIGAEMSRMHNDANILCLPADMLGQRLIDRIVRTWLSAGFEGGRHARRVRKVAAIEEGLDPSRVADTSAAAG
jgi:ribose 5-phosphate isomerase B